MAFIAQQKVLAVTAFGATTTNVTFTSTPTVGNTILVYITWATSTTACGISSVVDNAGNTYSLLGQQLDPGGNFGGNVFILAAFNCKTIASFKVTITMTAGTDTSENFSALLIAEANAQLFPVNNGAVNTTGASGAPSVVVPAVAGGGYVIAATVADSGAITAAGTGYTVIAAEPDTGGCWMFGLIAAGATTSTAAFGTSVTNWNIAAVPFSVPGAAGNPSGMQFAF